MLHPVLQILIQSAPAAVIMWGLTVIYYASRRKDGTERQRVLLGVFAIGTALIWAGLPSEVIAHHAGDPMAVWGTAFTALFFWACAVYRITLELRKDNGAVPKK